MDLQKKVGADFFKQNKSEEVVQMWIVKLLNKKRQYSEEMYQRWLSGIIGLFISTIATIIAIIVSFK